MTYFIGVTLLRRGDKNAYCIKINLYVNVKLLKCSFKKESSQKLNSLMKRELSGSGLNQSTLINLFKQLL
ncbi:hypothetical protein AS4_21360 [Acinetobacter guillouiae]|nr:hypothetical protein AS4_21360 [Acinetobacter guillouiae]